MFNFSSLLYAYEVFHKIGMTTETRSHKAWRVNNAKNSIYRLFYQWKFNINNTPSQVFGRTELLKLLYVRTFVRFIPAKSFSFYFLNMNNAVNVSYKFHKSTWDTVAIFESVRVWIQLFFSFFLSFFSLISFVVSCMDNIAA